MAKREAYIDWNEFGRDLLQKRIDKGVELIKTLNVSDLSKEIGVDKATVSRAFNGKPIQLLVLAKFCSWLGEPIDKYVEVVVDEGEFEE